MEIYIVHVVSHLLRKAYSMYGRPCIPFIYAIYIFTMRLKLKTIYNKLCQRKTAFYAYANSKHSDEPDPLLFAHMNSRSRGTFSSVTDWYMAEGSS